MTPFRSRFLALALSGLAVAGCDVFGPTIEDGSATEVPAKADVRAAGLSPDLDIRNQSEPSSYFLVFSAVQTKTDRRNGVWVTQTGHAYVTWVVFDAANRQSRAESRGMYPRSKADRFSLVRGLPGELRDDAINRGQKSDARYVVQVNRRAYEEALRVRTDWRSGTYALLRSDCVSFVADVARASGMKTPTRAGNPTPKGYVDALIRANGRS